VSRRAGHHEVRGATPVGGGQGCLPGRPAQLALHTREVASTPTDICIQVAIPDDCQSLSANSGQNRSSAPRWPRRSKNRQRSPGSGR